MHPAGHPETGSRPIDAPAPRRMGLLKAGAFAAFLLVLAELFAWPVGKLLQSKWWMYKDPQPRPNAIPLEEYLAIRDPVLGWPANREFGGQYAPDGSRWCREAEVAADAPWLLSLYGDSFTADWVGGNTDHWGCRIQRRSGAIVKNFGVGGYGTDQAFLRYDMNAGDRAQVVVLGHMSENIARNLTRYRDLHTRTRDWAFKPRYVLDSAGALVLVPMPTLSESEYRRFLGLAAPPFLLPHENFAPGGPAGAVRLDFPHLVSLVRNLGHWEVGARLAGVPTYAPFYDPAHPLGGMQLTATILLEFQRVAARRGQRSLLLLFPGPEDLLYYKRHGRWTYQSLIDTLEKAGASPFNFGPALLERMQSRPVDSLFQNFHYTQEISHLLADSVVRELIRRGQIAASLVPGT